MLYFPLQIFPSLFFNKKPKQNIGAASVLKMDLLLQPRKQTKKLSHSGLLGNSGPGSTVKTKTSKNNNNKRCFSEVFGHLTLSELADRLPPPPSSLPFPFFFLTSFCFRTAAQVCERGGGADCPCSESRSLVAFSAKFQQKFTGRRSRLLLLTALRVVSLSLPKAQIVPRVFISCKGGLAPPPPPSFKCDPIHLPKWLHG